MWNKETERETKEKAREKKEEKKVGYAAPIGMKYSKWDFENEGDSMNSDTEMNNHTENFNVFICVAELKSDSNMNQSYRGS